MPVSEQQAERGIDVLFVQVVAPGVAIRLFVNTRHFHRGVRRRSCHGLHWQLSESGSFGVRLNAGLGRLAGFWQTRLDP